MGYRISSLAHLPAVPDMDLYIFILGKRVWDRSLLKEVEDNFNKIAEEIGPKAALIRGSSQGKLAFDLMNCCSQGHRNLEPLIKKAESGDGSVLLLGSHPNELSPDVFALIASLSQIEKKFGTLSNFFTELCNYSVEKNPGFLEAFEDKSDDEPGLNSIIDLKPNFFGIGLNINALVEKFRARG